MPLLEVKNLSVHYGRDGNTVAAVQDVSLAIAPGEVAALVGESGSGKSSIALALTRLLPPPAHITGEVLFQGADLLQAAPAGLQAIRGGKIAYVFQDPSTSLNPVLTIGEQLAEMIQQHAPQSHPQARAQALEWLGRVGIPEPAQRLGAYPHELSGGMQQRVMIAMAMSGAPALLVADEPTTALDVTVQVQILKLLRELQQRLKLSVLLVSHDLAVVERIAHHVGVMAKGKLVEWGPVEQVLKTPKHPYTKELVSYRARLTLEPGAAHG